MDLQPAGKSSGKFMKLPECSGCIITRSLLEDVALGNNLPVRRGVLCWMVVGPVGLRATCRCAQKTHAHTHTQMHMCDGKAKDIFSTLTRGYLFRPFAGHGKREGVASIVLAVAGLIMGDIFGLSIFMQDYLQHCPNDGRRRFGLACSEAWGGGARAWVC